MSEAAVRPQPAQPLEGSASISERAHGRLAALVGKPWFWVALVLFSLIWPMVRTIQIKLPPPLPKLGHVPSFTLTDQYGKPFSSDTYLKGRVWVANFIFTRCPSICPLFTHKMFTLQDHARNLGEAFHLVSFTVDPEFDTPPVLLEYAKSNKVSPRMWSFLTGDRPALERIVGKGGLNQQMTKDGPDDDLMSIGHGGHFVLVDQNMEIRGYYDSSDDDATDRILRDAGLLANRGY